MHETSLIQFTLDAVEKRSMELGIRQVKTITLVVGEARGVVPELMQKAFRLLRRRNPLFQEAALEIEYRQIQLQCEACGTEYGSADIAKAVCPGCGSNRFRILQGKELYIESFETGEQNYDG